MATQYDPIAKDESLNTTEATPRNIADVLAEELSGIASALTPTQLASLADVTISSPSDGQTLKYDSVTQKWVNANDAGGHTIENPSGTDMTQRTNLQFADAHLTDDSVNDRTEVENIKDITSADYASATEDGFYNVTDESDEELTAADIAYDSNDSIKEKIDDLYYKANDTLVVTGDDYMYGLIMNGTLYMSLPLNKPVKATSATFVISGTSFGIGTIEGIKIVSSYTVQTVAIAKTSIQFKIYTDLSVPSGTPVIFGINGTITFA